MLPRLSDVRCIQFVGWLFLGVSVNGHISRLWVISFFGGFLQAFFRPPIPHSHTDPPPLPSIFVYLLVPHGGSRLEKDRMACRFAAGRSLTLPSVILLASLFLISLLAVTVEGNVDMNPGQLAIMLEIANAIPNLKTLAMGAWTEDNLRGSCVSPNLAHGVACESDDSGFVSVIDSNSFYIGVGTLPDSIGGLTKLKRLALTGPTGSIPSSIVNTALETFNFPVGLPLAGTIPMMPSTLKHFTAGFQYPESWTTGCLPQGMETIQILTYRFGNNPLPAEIFTMSSLKELRLQQAFFDGSAPDFSLLTSLTYLDISTDVRSSDNPMGTFNLAVWSTIKSLYLSSLNWVATLPTAPLSSLTNVQLYDLPFFSGNIHTEFFASSSLESVKLRMMPLVTGGLPAPSILPPLLTTLSLSYMGLSGPVDMSWIFAPSIQTLVYSDMSTVSPHQFTWPAANGACSSALTQVILYVSIERTF